MQVRWKVQRIFLIDTNFLTTALFSLFYCCEKGVYPYQYIDDWEKFNETSLPEKEDS